MGENERQASHGVICIWIRKRTFYQPQREWSLAAGVPGMPAALVHLAENYGNLPLQETLSPAIKYARKGFPVDEYLLRMLASRLNLLREISRDQQCISCWSEPAEVRKD